MKAHNTQPKQQGSGMKDRVTVARVRVFGRLLQALHEFVEGELAVAVLVEGPNHAQLVVLGSVDRARDPAAEPFH